MNIIESEDTFRLAAFFSTLILVAIVEIVRPARKLRISKLTRWANNLGLTVANSVLLRIVYPTTAVGLAFWAEAQGWGLFNVVALNPYIEILVAVIVMDMAIYFQHVLAHSVPLFWRFHRVHHADHDYDLTTGARFHPLEILVSMLYKFCFVIVLGAPAVAVILFEIILSSSAMFNHGNFKINNPWDHWIRYLIVTPSMHRVHHSVEDDETNSNFGFSLSWWDKIFGTYKISAVKKDDEIDIGIRTFPDPIDTVSVWKMLWLPFRKMGKGYVVNRRNWE